MIAASQNAARPEKTARDFADMPVRILDDQIKILLFRPRWLKKREYCGKDENVNGGKAGKNRKMILRSRCSLNEFGAVHQDWRSKITI